MAARYSLSNIIDIQNRRVFFDANVLIYIFWPTSSPDPSNSHWDWQAKYSSIYGRLVTQGNELIVDYLVISEFINRAIRIQFKNANSTLSFKQYRDSIDGQSTLTDIYTILQSNVFDKFNVIGKAFSKDEIQSFLFADNLDFTDKAIMQICAENDCILLTNDKDFCSVNLDLLSANRYILQN
jgi:predicted nucleic acid-binding protein